MSISRQISATACCQSSLSKWSVMLFRRSCVCLIHVSIVATDSRRPGTVSTARRSRMPAAMRSYFLPIIRSHAASDG